MNLLHAKVGLALGGGGARGIAHVGILRSFRQKHMPIYCLAGTSVGAFIGALFAFNKKPDEIEDIVHSLNFRRISALRLDKLGLINNQPIFDLLMKELGDVRIEDASLPFAIVCTDLISGKKQVFTEGPLALLVQASCCFPGFYSPVKYNDMLLVDGALSENIPVSAVRHLGANFIVAVSLSDHKAHFIQPKGFFEVVSRSFDILVDHASSHILTRASYNIELDLSFMSRFSLQHSEKAIELAYQASHKMLAKPLFYWWIKPFISYVSEIYREIVTLGSALLRHPKIKIPFRVSQVGQFTSKFKLEGKRRFEELRRKIID